MIMELTAIFKGKVQGVCFRATIQKIAKRLELQGYAKNMKDMSVEVIAVGEKSVLEEFVRLILKNPGRAEVINVETFYSSSSVKYIGFSVL